ncbi:MAG: Rieske 2Fe-2S domain-containing protein [Ardenticatenaceae bacterium]|nr:Rieske 2Fe-2S domain-containing protein [Ardenticatenaceae bacterium]
MTESERRPVEPFEGVTAPATPSRWRTEFPYHWDTDELVSRRELLQLAVWASGALFAGTAVLAILGRLGTRRRGAPQPVAQVDEVPLGEAFYFNYPEPDDQAMLLHLPGGEFVAYSQKCTHLSCAVYYQPERDRLFCPCHEGVFNPRTGEPVAGPPQRRLPRILLRREGDTLIAVEEVP